MRPIIRKTASLAFTILELMAVCAIAVVVAAMVVSVFAAVRENARRTRCVSNLRQIHRAIRMYADDWNGIEPQVGVKMSFSEVGLPPIPAGDRLEPYLKSRAIWRCPNDWRDPEIYYRSYHVAFHDDLMAPGGMPFPERIALCGDRYPLYGCPFHGALQGVDLGHIILRWNGSARWTNLYWPYTPCLDGS